MLHDMQDMQMRWADAYAYPSLAVDDGRIVQQ